MSHGHFSEDPQTQWITQPEDRDMKLLAAFSFVDPTGHSWNAEEGDIINGASIPRALWTVVGSPYTGSYRRASIVHDIACEQAGSDHDKRLAADKMFYDACRAGGCSPWEATVLYVGVRFGEWISGADLLEDTRVRTERTPAERQVEEDFRATCELVVREGDLEDVESIAKRTEAAMTQVAAARFRLAEHTAELAAR